MRFMVKISIKLEVGLWLIDWVGGCKIYPNQGKGQGWGWVLVGERVGGLGWGLKVSGVGVGKMVVSRNDNYVT